jgi:hypothetical protein
MQAAMSASRAPTVQESNGRYAVAIAPGVVLRWWFELHDRNMRCFVKVDATALKDYALVDIDARTDIISFPVLAAASFATAAAL